ncbi:MAG: DUF3098 domain-containing protein [candidate division WOR-3 bacterium]|nr:DUF3098 domain-containing protein [candidate division WOR-3 bacterium]MCX7757067.1 DUF3098 domain-containing protein [candidate division WOR-3 bacterium]MDW7987234.1 hypothetical protein [candidate division WOR-3 bacterium]
MKEKTKPLKEKPKAKVIRRPNIAFTTKNYVLFGVGVVTIGLGYIFLARGSTVLAPILLVLGYVILIPLSIIIK